MFKLNIPQIMIYVFPRVENILGKGKNFGYQIQQCFKKTPFSKVVKTWDCNGFSRENHLKYLILVGEEYVADSVDPRSVITFCTV